MTAISAAREQSNFIILFHLDTSNLKRDLMEHRGNCNFLSVSGVAELYEYKQQTCVGYKIVTSYHAH